MALRISLGLASPVSARTRRVVAALRQKHSAARLAVGRYGPAARFDNKLDEQPAIWAPKNAEHPGGSVGLYLFVVGAGEGLGVVGFVIGLFWWPMELVAASGVVLLM